MQQFFTILLILGLTAGYSQSEIINSPSVIAGGGDTWIQDDYNLSFTIGELAIETFSESQTIFTQGFHQENYTITHIGDKIDNLNIIVFPNPTQDILNINCNSQHGTANLYIKDVKGSIIYSLLDYPANQIQQINFREFSQGTYFLEVILNSTDKMVFQIQKIN